MRYHLISENIKSLLLVLIMAITTSAIGQELKLEVNVVFQSADESDKDKMKILEGELQNFLNSTKWTNTEVQEFEKIRGTITLNVQPRADANALLYDSELLLNIIRPVYGSTYTTSLLNHNDDNFVFQYDDGLKLTKMNTGAFIDNISSVASFYAYLIIGLDRDSFEKGAGEPFFNICRDIANAVPANYQSNKSSGWYNKDFSFNRNKIITELIDIRLGEPYQEAWYDYHLSGLDQMSTDKELGISNIREALTKLEELQQIETRSMLLQMFFDCKTDEITEIFSVGDMAMRREVYDQVSKLSPATKVRFSKIRSN